VPEDSIKEQSLFKTSYEKHFSRA